MMLEKQNLLVTLTVADLQQLIQVVVKGELENFKSLIQTNPKSLENDSDELLTREQASKLLNVSYTTLFHWNNDGILPIEKLGKRVYYPKSRIMEKLNLTKAP
ncbi:helix-turn-helix domain-containing protein [Flavobacterium sp. 2]|uniref:helix-turn-helix domain-containing protein n=1 Tax=Flavobacterium sp. 2 TaxID=308053 RepID=UPI000C1746C0|nr:helix-turn-helix domain-containing protein [Flavobacterium sp. 2]PIF69459.1 helix-turn-helix protein [Flavobacterium sp. 2]